MEDTRLPKCVVFGELMGGAGCVEGQEKEWMGCFLDDLRAFAINVDQWTTAAQDEGEWRKTAKKKGGTFHGEMDHSRESQGWTTACSSMQNVTGGTEERIAQSKRARPGSLAIVHYPQVWRTCILRTFFWFADAVLSFSGVTFVSFCFH